MILYKSHANRNRRPHRCSNRNANITREEPERIGLVRRRKTNQLNISHTCSPSFGLFSILKSPKQLLQDERREYQAALDLVPVRIANIPYTCCHHCIQHMPHFCLRSETRSRKTHPKVGFRRYRTGTLPLSALGTADYARIQIQQQQREDYLLRAATRTE